ncbi:MAG TPA: non-canonical purine NTP pyrophosphatase, RdgB/HAM1 family [Lachnospiraceae bacterium]|nr:non-canonical purine NTP pyrophosphatase, RdgB/HAM1 family [Lachnospiraceae bacterium]
MKIIFATGNKAKLREVREIVADLGIEVVSMKDAGIDVEIIEDGKTFVENALIKARTVCAACGEVTMSDDSGLVIDALNGEPGILSARYMGEDTSYHVKNMNLVGRLEGVPEKDRTARFVCAIACVFPDGRELTCQETFEGIIGYEEKGANGFGYDPIFYVPEKGCYSAELAPEEKNAISHRGKALRAMRRKLEEVL